MAPRDGAAAIRAGFGRAKHPWEHTAGSASTTSDWAGHRGTYRHGARHRGILLRLLCLGLRLLPLVLLQTHGVSGGQRAGLVTGAQLPLLAACRPLPQEESCSPSAAPPSLAPCPRGRRVCPASCCAPSRSAWSSCLRRHRRKSGSGPHPAGGEVFPHTPGKPDAPTQPLSYLVPCCSSGSPPGRISCLEGGEQQVRHSPCSSPNPAVASALLSRDATGPTRTPQALFLAPRNKLKPEPTALVSSQGSWGEEQEGNAAQLGTDEVAGDRARRQRCPYLFFGFCR